MATILVAVSTIACAQERQTYVPPAFVTSGSAEFDAWRTGFAFRAVQEAGKDRAIVEATLAGISPNLEVKRLNDSQPEFTRPVWAYIASAVSAGRIAQGRTLLAQKRDILLGMSTTVGVPTEYAVSIWGMESGFGSNKGNSDVVRSLATLAYQGRRTALGESELLAVFDILARGEATRPILIGSWAGAMGHTQFMPSSFLSRAVDGDNDGKRDIWNNSTDALASTINYLARAGWVKNEPWGFEVTAPANFDWSLTDGTMRTLAFWESKGVVSAQTRRLYSLPETTTMRLIAPAGAGGAAFLVGANFDAFRAYNASDAYALSVGLLGDQIAQRGAMPTRWPTDNPPIGRTDALELQSLLLGLGYQIGTPDGQVGPRTRAALRTFQQKENILADGYPSRAALLAVRAGAARVGVSYTPAPVIAPMATGGAAAPAPVTRPVRQAPPASRVDPNYKGPPPVKMTW